MHWLRKYTTDTRSTHIDTQIEREKVRCERYPSHLIGIMDVIRIRFVALKRQYVKCRADSELFESVEFFDEIFFFVFLGSRPDSVITCFTYEEFEI